MFVNLPKAKILKTSLFVIESLVHSGVAAITRWEGRDLEIDDTLGLYFENEPNIVFLSRIVAKHKCCEGGIPTGYTSYVVMTEDLVGAYQSELGISKES